MSARKRWRTTVWPTSNRRQHPSQRQTYDFIDGLRQARALGMTRIHLVVVEVSEDKGPWRLYERVQLPAPVLAGSDTEGPPPPGPGEYATECCASGRCEVCSPGFQW